MTRSFIVLSAITSFAVLAGCENKSDPAYAGNQGYGYPQQQQPGYPQQQYPQQPGYPQQQQPGYPQQQQPGYPQQQQPGYPQQPATQQPGTQQPAQTGIPGLPGFQIPGWPSADPNAGGTTTTGGGTTSGSPAQPIDPNLASVAVIPLMQLQGTHAPGMAKEGGVLAGNFQAGQSLEQGFTLQPNKCYTVIATAAGIQELDAKIIVLTPIPGQSPVLAQDSMTGATAVVGANGACFRWQFPVGANAKFVITATAGSGVAAAQLYSK